MPVLTGGDLPSPLTESLAISKWLCQHHFPALAPPELEVTIDGLLGKIHDIAGLPLSSSETEELRLEGIPCEAVDELAYAGPTSQRSIVPHCR